MLFARPVIDLRKACGVPPLAVDSVVPSDSKTFASVAPESRSAAVRAVAEDLYRNEIKTTEEKLGLTVQFNIADEEVTLSGASVTETGALATPLVVNERISP